MVGRIGTLLGAHGVNIATMSLSRNQAGGRALTVLNLDTAPPVELLAEIAASDDIHSAQVVELWLDAWKRFPPDLCAAASPISIAATDKTIATTPNDSLGTNMLTSIIGTIIIGLVVGVIAKLLMPGRDPGGCIITILLGIAGAFVGTWIGRLFWGSNYVAGWILSIIGAMILLLIYRMIVGKRGWSFDELDASGERLPPKGLNRKASSSTLVDEARGDLPATGQL
jgi:uncharacterized membrane protein YeaQ/YmgE (transglycosylase-associated protein family)